jgi:membrane-bound lytic murein transglycosylase D
MLILLFNMIKRILYIIFLAIAAIPTLAQNPDSLFTEQDYDADTTLFDPTDQDTVVSGEIMIDDEPDAIYSVQLDSLMQSNEFKRRFHLDGGETNFTDDFPRNVPDSVYIKRLQDAEMEVDLSYNELVKKYIQMYTERKRGLVEVMLGLSAYYFPIFEETLDKYEMPLELKYLAIIESALNPTARSRAGAVGLWQFMYGTAKNLQLEVTTFVDERSDPVKSTDAAALYLKLLYDMYNDWHLAIAAYNCGPGNVNRAIRRSGGKMNYWEIYYRLPKETRGYVPAYIAAMYTFTYYKEHNLVPMHPNFSLSVDTVQVNDYLHFDQLSATLGISKEEIQNLNPVYRRDVIPAKADKSYPLILPNDKLMSFIDKDTAVFAYERDKYFPNNTLVNPTASTGSYFTPADVKNKDKVVYTVKSGDNVGYIANWFHVYVADLRYWNNIHRDMIRAGQKLAIYVPKGKKEYYDKFNTMSFAEKQASIGKTPALTAQKQETKPEPADAEYIYHTVKSGDTLWDIAQKYAGISADDIKKLNKLSNDRSLYVGQKLKIRRKG